VVENLRFAVGIVILSVTVPEIVFPVSAAILPFPVVGHCRNHLATLYSGSPWSKIPDLPLQFRLLSVVIPVVQLYPVLAAISLFPVVDRCYSHLFVDTFATSPWSKTPGLPSEL